MWYDTLLANQIIPDSIIRLQIKNLLKQRLKDEQKPTNQALKTHIKSLVAELKDSPIAINTQDANGQHYELPTAFFQYALGKNLKYSSCLFENGAVDLDDAEDQMLRLTCDRADLKTNQNILELGCGWGSLSLYMAKNFPSNNITAVSNSRTQKQFIDAKAKEQNLTNLTVITADMNDFNTSDTFDRVVSIEMFEHMRNYNKLFQKINKWLKEDGKLFVHIFTHHKYAYKFEVKDESDWMSKYFFTGGIMPSDDLLYYFDEYLIKENYWVVNGKNYQQTAEHWLINTDKNKHKIMPIMEQTYGKGNAKLWFAYWRIFFMACAELWGYNNGEEWRVSHYLFNKK